MEDMWKNAESGRLLTAALASGKPLAIVCHGPAAILATRRKGVSPFAGYRVTAYTNDDEDAVGLRVKAPWTAICTRARIRQNPASAAPLAEQVLAALH